MFLKNTVLKPNNLRLYSTVKSTGKLVYGVREKKAISLSDLDDIIETGDGKVQSNLFTNLPVSSVVKKCVLELIKADTAVRDLKVEDIKCSDVQAQCIPEIVKKNETPQLRKFLNLLKQKSENKEFNVFEESILENFQNDKASEDITEITGKNYFDLVPDLIKPSFPVDIKDNKIAPDVFSIGAETGSGKTVAYLTPLLEYLTLYQSKYENEETKGPIVRSVVFQPTNELVAQTYDFLVRNGNPINLNVKKFDIDVPPSEMHAMVRESSEKPIDIVVCTPEKLIRSLEQRNSFDYLCLANRLEYCVLDETDTLLDRNGSLSDLNDFFSKCNNLNTIVNCSGTITDNYLNNLKELEIIKFISEHGKHRILTTKNLHKVNHSINYYNIDCSIGALNNSRLKAVGQIIFSIYKKNQRDYQNDPYFMKIFNRIMIFADTKESVIETQEYLKKLLPSANIQILVKETPNNERKSILHPYLNFSSRDEVYAEQRKKKIPKMLKNFEWLPDSNIKVPVAFTAETVYSQDIFLNKKQDINILITTDILSRGINFKKLKNLIIMEPPKNVLSFIHRVGRVCRFGDSGNAHYANYIKAYNDNKIEKNASVYMITDLKDTKHSWVRKIKEAITFKKKFV